MKISLAIFLVLLQWLTPLMHAHAGQNSVDGKLHIPGFEKYTQLAPVLSEDTQSFVSNTIPQVPTEGVVFAVDAGLKQSCYFDLTDDSLYLPAQTSTLVEQAGLTLLNPLEPVSCLVVVNCSAFSPRAPPLS